MHLSPLKTKKYVKAALKDERVRKAVDKATQTVINARKHVIDQIGYWEDLRLKNHAMKRDVIENLADYLQMFESNCRKNEIQVLWAADALEARQIILDLAKKNGVKKIVKSKSLTTEEIELNPALQENGIESLETDLGEYIVQLMDQIPSHLTMPAMHLSRQDIGRLFQEKLCVEYTDDPVALMGIARKILREHFLSSDMGLSGANFGVAGSGVLCILENEANAHLTLSLPRLHVVVMGIEKLVPDLKSVPFILKALASSATGQKSTCYVNFIGGPSREKYGEGPEEVIVILLDNGRSKIVKEPLLRETLFCIRCGACLNHCPVYQQIGGHAYGSVYMGPIGICLTPQYLGESEGRHSPSLCSICGACYDVCPVKIDMPRHILMLRNRIVEKGYSMKAERIGMKGWAFLTKHPMLYRLATWFPGQFQRLLPKGKAYPAPG